MIDPRHTYAYILGEVADLQDHSTMIGSDSSTRSGLTQFKDGFEVWDVSQLLSDDIFG